MDEVSCTIMPDNADVSCITIQDIRRPTLPHQVGNGTGYEAGAAAGAAGVDDVDDAELDESDDDELDDSPEEDEEEEEEEVDEPDPFESVL